MSTPNHIFPAFQSLSPISEVYSCESMHFGNKIQYSGLIKRDNGLLSIWQTRIFTIKYRSNSNLELIISQTKQGNPQETILLSKVKLSKKCTKIENHDCFGMLVENKKYLISLKNVHECQKFHAEISYIRKNPKILLNFYQSQNSTEARSYEKKNFEGPLNQTSPNSAQSHENDQLEEDQHQELINRRYQLQKRLKLLKKSQEEQIEQIFDSNVCQVPSSICQQEKEEYDSIKSNLLSEAEMGALTSNDNFLLYPNTQKQKILINRQNSIKNTFVFFTSLNIHSCIKNFLKFHIWNGMVSRIEILEQNETSKIIFIQFIKNRTSTQSRCAIAEVSIQQNGVSSLLKIKSVQRPHYQFISRKKVIHLELVAKLMVDSSNKLEKIMTIVLSIKPSEQFELGIKFINELKFFESKAKKLI